MKHLLFVSLLAACAATATAEPNLKLHNRFGDHMVLQQGKETILRGSATTGTEITVEFVGETLSATSDKNGHWIVPLPLLETSAEPKTLTITAGEDTITLSDILVGEVWLCSGQSNMARNLERTANADAAATIPNLRLFATQVGTAKAPRIDTTGTWQLCTEETALAFSAVGYLFGKELLENLDTPIGLISAAWGGKTVEAFTSREAIAKAGKPLLDEWLAREAKYDAKRAFANYERNLANWTARATAEKENPSGIAMPKRPGKPTEPMLSPGAPSAIYNSMIAPWTDYAIAGAIWYQGESNRYRAANYATLFPAMITDWRAQWDDEFPFYFVQLAAYKDAPNEPAGQSMWAELQNSQRVTLEAVESVGMAVANDIGDPDDIHPADKSGVAERLALLARAGAYDEEIIGSGPLNSKVTIADATITITFDEVGDGLETREGGPLGGFVIAGDDQKFLSATATIGEDGRTVTVSHPDITEPKAVRYAWSANPTEANLVNSAGLPTSIFRSDDWTLSTDGYDTLASVSKRMRTYNLEAQHERFRAMGWEPLFNGKNLDGWRNPYDYGDAKVVDGEIHLSSDQKFFLVSEGEYDDFSLQVDVHLPPGKANSGVMFRANVEPGKVFGYQAECDGSDRRWSGGLYDEGRRKWLWPSKGENPTDSSKIAHEEGKSQEYFAKPEVRDALRRNDWNTYKITCKGNRIQIHVNGVLITDYIDDVDSSGPIAIQHHGEEGAVYRFKRIILKEM